MRQVTKVPHEHSIRPRVQSENDVTLYGLTCGYWTDDPEDLDDHVIQHHNAGSGDQLFDLFDDQAPTDPVLRNCSDGIR
jgi:hypothetical protein